MGEKPVDTERAELRSKIGQRLRALRLETGKSQKQLAQELGVTYQQLHKYEHGTNQIPSTQIFRLCELLGCSADYLVGRTDSQDHVLATERHRRVMETARLMRALPEEQQAVVYSVARALKGGPPEAEPTPG